MQHINFVNIFDRLNNHKFQQFRLIGYFWDFEQYQTWFSMLSQVIYTHDVIHLLAHFLHEIKFNLKNSSVVRCT